MKEKAYELARICLKGNRDKNQDRFTVRSSDDTLLLAVADGMGGHPPGEVAAEILTESCEKIFEDVEKPILDPQHFLTAVFHQAHLAILDYGQRQQPPLDPRTTAVVALIQHNTAYWAHLGDSRLYVFRDAKKIAQTVDHSYVEQLHRDGLISGDDRNRHPQRNYVTRSLGGTRNRLQITYGEPLPLHSGDIVMLCTDGLWGQIEEDNMITLLLEPSASLHSATSLLANKAEALAYPESDNIAVLTLKWLRSAPEGHPLPKKLNLSQLQENHPTPASRPPEHLDTVLDDLRETVENLHTEIQEEQHKE